MEERKKGRKPKKPREVPLTPKMQASVVQDDDSLNKLLQDHHKDFEPSPLDDDLPDRDSPRKANVYRKP
jgi:hypothetical protein